MTGLTKLLIANRGEIAIRVMRAAEELGIEPVMVFSADDRDSLHARAAKSAHELVGTGSSAYLDVEALLAIAGRTGCDGVHPGYGFLAENVGFARRCGEEGITFVGPSLDVLESLGDKSKARALAAGLDVLILPGSSGPVTLQEARDFRQQLGAGGDLVIKAVAGGGGRGMRVVTAADDLDEAYSRCQSEAEAAFGSGAVYLEKLVAQARHLEVQIVGDGSGAVVHLGERECSVQRRHQKLVELTPCPTLSDEGRHTICSAAVRMAGSVSYAGVGTFEFLQETTAESGFFFIEANPRIQVEHTVTEEVTGIDLVRLQLEVAGGATLADLGLDQDSVPEPKGYAIQARVNTEQILADGSVRPTGGELTAFHLPAGPGIRVDTYGYPGYRTNPNFDSLLAKVVAHAPTGGFSTAVSRLRRALGEFHITGVETNTSLLDQVLGHEDFAAGKVYTRWLDDNVEALTALIEQEAEPESIGGAGAGATLDKLDPLASLDFYRSGQGTRSMSDSAPTIVGPPGTDPVPAPLQGTVIEIHVAEEDEVRQGQLLFTMSALKMEHDVKAPLAGVVRRLTVTIGETVYDDHVLAFIEPRDTGEAITEDVTAVEIDHVRLSLQALFDRRQFLLDENRPAAVERRHGQGRRTVRENISQLVDENTWVEYGPLALAGQSKKRSLEELIRKTPADGLVAGIGSVNGDLFDPKRARTMFISYDDTVFAGTQGGRGHDKTDRMMELANELSLPLIFHCEGAGGRSGDTDGSGAGHPFVRTWEKMGYLSGTVPMIGVTAGWCYAGNAALLGCTDIIIATEDALIAMGGPATIEGGGMGAFLPEEVGPISDLAPAGSVDIVVPDHNAAIATSKKCLSYFQGSIDTWEEEDQRLLRHVIPEKRGRSFDIREVIRVIADRDSVLELRPDFGQSMVTAFIRVEGQPVGLTANNNAHIGGAIDSDGSDKVARFWQLCDAFNIPIVTLVDTPGMMVGPDVERTGLIRHCSRLFVTGVNLVTPRFSVILRGGYALGALSVMTGNSRAPVFTVAWPQSEHGGMNMEAGVLLSYRDELAAIDDVEERAAEYERLVEVAYDQVSALSAASRFAFDDVIDPAETRRWIANGLLSVPDSEPLRRGRAQFLDTW